MTDHLSTGAQMLAEAPDFKLIGRQQELDKLCAILVRKDSNSVHLVAPSGVGASSLCLGLQALKGDENAPFDIVSKSLFWLDVDAMFATGDPAEIDASFRRALARTQTASEPVLIIGNAGGLVDACQAHSASHFSNALSGLVRDGKLQVILETNDDDASKVLSWHWDIRERYTLLDVTEPEGQALKDIVVASAAKLQTFHKVSIEADAIEAAVELTQKYRSAGSTAAQPKRTIELLDRALASYRLAAHSQPPAMATLRSRIDGGNATDAERAEFDTMVSTHKARQDQLKTFHRGQRNAELEIAKLQEQLEEARANAAANPSDEAPQPMGFSAMTSGGRFASAEEREINGRILKFRDALDQHKTSYAAVAAEMNAELALDRTWVMGEFARISGIPAAKLGEDQMAILRDLDSNLKKNVYGQDHAITQLANAVKVARVGRRNKKKPQASFMFAGASGVGKTELTKQLAAILLGDMEALLRFDMSEYMEKHAVAKLIGAPPGYDGFEAGGILTNAMRKNRVRIILFDEIEKAHPDVFNLMLQILDDGRLTDSIGRVADFSDAIIIMTTNTGQAQFLDVGMTFEEAMAACMIDLEETYRSEFLNRFNGRQNIVGFKRLELPSVNMIIQREIRDLQSAYVDRALTISFPDTEIAKFCADRYVPKIGARGLPGMINTDLEPRIVNALLDGSVGDGATFDVCYDTSARRFAIEMVSAPV